MKTLNKSKLAQVVAWVGMALGGLPAARATTLEYRVQVAQQHLHEVRRLAEDYQVVRGEICSYGREAEPASMGHPPPGAITRPDTGGLGQGSEWFLKIAKEESGTDDSTGGWADWNKI